MKSVTFDDREIQLVRAIVMDKDREGALKFLTDVIWERAIKDTEPKACGPKPVGSYLSNQSGVATRGKDLTL